jgi:hypothetical protein
METNSIIYYRDGFGRISIPIVNKTVLKGETICLKYIS